MPPRWKHAPPGGHWGEFGPDDQRGRMNLVDTTKVLQGVAEVKTGRTFCLSLPLDVPGGQRMNPRRMPPRRYSVLRDGKSAGQQGFCWSYQSEDPDLTDVVNDDVVLMSLQYSTQWDSLSHMGSHFDADGDGVAEAVFYNGFRAGVDIRPGTEDPGAAEPWARYRDPKADVLDIAVLAEHGAQGRGVMIDLEHHIGRQRQAVGYDALMRILDADGVAVEPGDMVCIHTGFADTLLAMNRNPDVEHLHATGSGLDGHDGRLLNWITDTRLACLLADNPAVELVVPKLASGSQPGTPMRQPRLPLHEHCLFKNGIHLGELWYLTELAHWLRLNQRNRFLLTAPPLRLPGAVGSPATPIATV
ncbi:cyclase family protein [Hydrogenophaga pseudoflava]|uniref:cyclase family protein n=1 Tax=Hydrogenophaga pseudoflava TaxID=47421 RepID=UPI0027E4C19F|nr:cyclase family protein [Hydrogenophaga pseudoflava]MDQ7742944.1 cyclase family protein [Hydrogenophaga pseudoflava]